MSAAPTAVTEALYGYLLSATVREPEVLSRLRLETERLPTGGMRSIPVAHVVVS